VQDQHVAPICSLNYNAMRKKVKQFFM